jgi:hypothetical protein
MEQSIVKGMAFIRLISATIEVTAVIIMWRLTTVDSALRLNSILGLVGPTIFILVSALGIAGMVVKVNPMRMAVIIIGVILVIWGTRG